MHDAPGVTRDRKYADASLGPLNFMIVDTPGLEEAQEGQIEYGMTEQTMSAAKTADVVCLIVDGAVGITPQDIFFANAIRKVAKTCLLLINKCEKDRPIDTEYYKIGFGAPLQISAEHGVGMMSLCEKLIEILESPFDDEKVGRSVAEDRGISIAIVGRPNSGKSTFVNALLQENRVLASQHAGTTRDSIEIKWNYRDTQITLIDTAGLRRKSNISDNLEKLSASDTLYNVKYANTVVLMLDSTKPLEHQDLTIANFIIDEGRSLVLAFNKWDLVEQKALYKSAIEHKLSVDLPQVQCVPCVYLSALNNERTEDVIGACIDIYHLWNKKIPTAKLNQWIQMATEYHQLPLQKHGKRLRIKYGTQVGIRPPTFKFFCNKADNIPDSYKRYLINDLRRSFNMPGVPIRMQFVSSENPYDKKK